MSVQPLLKPSQPDWSTDLAKLGPQIAEEGRRCDAENRYVGANIATLREHGFLGLAVPAELGGGGLSRIELANMLRELAHYCSATALVLAMHTHTVAAAAWRWRYQKAPTDGLLKRVAAERLQLLSSGGSDWLPGSGTAEKVEGGYKVNGLKVFASGAPSANIFMTGAVEQTAEGPTALQFGVPMNSPGVSIVETWDTLGMRGTASHNVKLENVFVADAAIAARRPAGVWHPSFHLISMVAFPLIYAVYTGVAEAARDIAVAAASKRKQAGDGRRRRPARHRARRDADRPSQHGRLPWSRRSPARRPPTRSSSIAPWSRAARSRRSSWRWSPPAAPASSRACVWSARSATSRARASIR